MKFSLVKNDKSTALDELYLFLMILAFCAAGVALFIFKPSFWVIDSSDTLVFGVLMIITGVMFIPGLIYRLLTNDK